MKGVRAKVVINRFTSHIRSSPHVCASVCYFVPFKCFPVINNKLAITASDNFVPSVTQLRVGFPPGGRRTGRNATAKIDATLFGFLRRRGRSSAGSFSAIYRLLQTGKLDLFMDIDFLFLVRVLLCATEWAKGSWKSIPRKPSATTYVTTHASVGWYFGAVLE